MLRQPPISTLLPIPTLCRSCARPGTSSRVPPAWGVGTTLVTRQLGAAPLVSRGACRDAERLTVERVSAPPGTPDQPGRSEEHTSELQSRQYIVCRLLLEKKK